MTTFKFWTMAMTMTMTVLAMGCRDERSGDGWQEELSLSAETLQATDAVALLAPQPVVAAENLLLAAEAWDATLCAAVETFYPDGYLTVSWDGECTTAEYGLSVEGTVTATWQGQALVLETTNLVVEGEAIEGTVVAQSGEVSIDLKTDDSDLSLWLAFGAGEGLTVSGAVADGNLEADISDVHWAPGSCYPDGGEIVIDRLREDVVIEFTAETADSGTVLVNGQADQLPAYGDCP